MGALGQGTAVSLVPAHPPLPLSWPPDHSLSPFSPCPRTHVAVPCSLPPATNLQGTRSWSHTGPPTPVAPRPHCHSPRMRASAIGAMRLQQLGDNETAVGSGSGRKCNLISPWGQDDVLSPPRDAFPPFVVTPLCPLLADTHTQHCTQTLFVCPTQVITPRVSQTVHKVLSARGLVCCPLWDAKHSTHGFIGALGSAPFGPHVGHRKDCSAGSWQQLSTTQPFTH